MSMRRFSVRLSGWLAASTPALIAAQSPHVLAVPQFPTGKQPSALASADFDQDGRSDIAVANAGGNKLSLFRGSSAGPIALADAGCGPEPRDLAFGDLDGDGDPDAVVALALTDQLAVLRGTSGAGFALPVAYTTGDRPISVALGDFDQDGDLDVASADTNSNLLSVHWNDASGGLVAPLSVFGGNVPSAVRAADMDQDGTFDLVCVATGDSAVRVLAGGTFSVDALLNVGPFPTRLALGNLDGNAYPDFAVASDVGFGPLAYTHGAAGYAALAVSGESLAVSIGDFDGNGQGEIAQMLSSAGYVSVLRNPAAFAGPAPELRVASGSTAHALLALDADGDGKQDLLCAHANTNSLGWLTGDGRGGFEQPASFELQAPPGTNISPDYVQALDANSDGALDLVGFRGGHPQFEPGRLFLQPGDGDGGFLPTSLLPNVPVVPTVFHRDFDAGDLDGDGNADLLISAYSGSFTVLDSYQVLLRNGPSTFAPPIVSEVAHSIRRAVLADLDLDGRLDAISACDKFFTSSPGGTVSVSFGSGDGLFDAAVNYEVGSCESLAVADFDADGILDVAAGTSLSSASPSDARVRLLRGIGGGALQEIAQRPVSHSTRALTAADLDGDGAADVAVVGVGVSSPQSTLSFVRGDGAGGLAAPIERSAGAFPSDLQSADLDADGLRDVVGIGAGSTSLWKGGGAGLGAEQRYIGGWASERGFALGDFDRDGRIEIAQPFVGLGGANAPVSVHENLHALPAGTNAFGFGTPGCNGGHGLSANGAPQIGNAAFELVGTQAPPNSLGLRVIGALPLVAGGDPFALHFVLHVDPFGALLPLAWSFHSDALGQARSPLPIPADGALAGAQLHAQVVWPWAGACQPSPFDLSSSRGLTLTVQP